MEISSRARAFGLGWSVLASVFVSCGGEEGVDAGAGGAGGVGVAEPVLPGTVGGAAGALGLGGAASLHGDGACETVGVCSLLECDTGTLTGDHVSVCSPIEFTTNPPTSGPHYGIWAQFGVYDASFLRGFWIHTIEHSGVALLYNCDAATKVGLDCESLVRELRDFYDSFADDPLCTDVPHRLLVAPDPLLDAPFAAVAWGYYLKGRCFDPSAVSAFIEKHYGMNYEDLCASGVDPASIGCD